MFPGSSVKVNDTVLAVVNRPNPLLVAAPIPEKHLPRLRAAMQNGGMQVDVSIPSDRQQSFKGVVRFLDNAVDTATGTILMKAEIPNQEEKLTPGQFLNVALILETLKDAVTIPNEAVQQGADGNYIYVVKDDGTVENRDVSVLAAYAGFSAISKGVQLGDTVVTDGHLRLTPGAKIKAKSAGDDDKGDKAGTSKQSDSDKKN